MLGKGDNKDKKKLFEKAVLLNYFWLEVQQTDFKCCEERKTVSFIWID